MEGEGKREREGPIDSIGASSLKRKSRIDGDSTDSEVRDDDEIPKWGEEGGGNLDEKGGTRDSLKLSPFEGPKALKYEITKGIEQIKQRRASCSEEQEGVLEKMLASYNEALSILIALEGQVQYEVSSASSGLGGSEGQSSQLISSQSDTRFADDITSIRRGSYRWTEHVRVESVDGSYDDGYPWRKFGEKDILGSRYPRSYYRCTHRRCLAKRRVQRTDEDPLQLEVVYNGKHTCGQGAPVALPQAAASSEEPNIGSG